MTVNQELSVTETEANYDASKHGRVSLATRGIVRVGATSEEESVVSGLFCVAINWTPSSLNSLLYDSSLKLLKVPRVNFPIETT